MKYDLAKKCYEALKMDAKYLNGMLQLRKSFYLNEVTGYISYKKINDHTYNKEIDEGYEIIGIIDDNVQPSEYCGQTGY